MGGHAIDSFVLVDPYATVVPFPGQRRSVLSVLSAYCASKGGRGKMATECTVVVLVNHQVVRRKVHIEIDDRVCRIG